MIRTSSSLCRLLTVVPYRRYFYSRSFRDQRVAGRQRFYKNVNIQIVAPPWQEQESSTVTTIESPISAGVDQTQSATGVSRSIDYSRLETNLFPRRPGTTSTSRPDHKQLEWFGVTLDGKLLKTPLGQSLAVPSPLLAMAIAAEWNFQANLINPTQMPLMTLACTALDQTASNMPLYQNKCLQYFNTDATCYFADPAENRVLYQRQRDTWEPLHDRLEACIAHRPAVSYGSTEGVLIAKNGSRLPHSAQLMEYARNFVESLDAWHLSAFHAIVAEAKSFVVAWAALSSSKLPVSEAVAAGRVEEEFQIANWGLVEGGHDYDRLNASVQMTSAVVLKDALAEDCGLWKETGD